MNIIKHHRPTIAEIKDCIKKHEANYDFCVRNLMTANETTDNKNYREALQQKIIEEAAIINILENLIEEK